MKRSISLSVSLSLCLSLSLSLSLSYTLCLPMCFSGSCSHDKTLRKDAFLIVQPVGLWACGHTQTHTHTHMSEPYASMQSLNKTWLLLIFHGSVPEN